MQCHLVLDPAGHSAVLVVPLLYSWGWPVRGQGKQDMRKERK